MIRFLKDTDLPLDAWIWLRSKSLFSSLVYIPGVSLLMWGKGGVRCRNPQCRPVWVLCGRRLICLCVLLYLWSLDQSLTSTVGACYVFIEWIQKLWRQYQVTCEPRLLIQIDSQTIHITTAGQMWAISQTARGRPWFQPISKSRGELQKKKRAKTQESRLSQPPEKADCVDEQELGLHSWPRLKC